MHALHHPCSKKAMHAVKNDAQVYYSNFMHVQMVSLRMTEEADTIDTEMGLLQFGLCDTF